jgi:hypothetical protein
MKRKAPEAFDSDGGVGGCSESEGSERTSKGSKAESQRNQNKAAKADAKVTRHLPRGVNAKKKFCRGCKKVLPVEKFAINQALHVNCKQICDNLRGMAKRQGHLDWFQNIYQDDKMLQSIIASYETRCPTQGDGTRKKAPFKLAEFREAYETSTEVIKDDIGRMMDEEDFVKFATTDRKPRLTMQHAKTEWEHMKDTKKGRVHDNKNGDIRFRVAVDELIIFRDAYRCKKELSMLKSSARNPDAAALQKMKNELRVGHNSMNMDDRDMFDDIAMQMGCSGAQVDEDGFHSAFDGAAAGDIRNLIPDGMKGGPSDHEEIADDQSDALASGDEQSLTLSKKKEKRGAPILATPKKKGQASWFDAETSISRTQRSWLEAVNKLEQALLEQLPGVDETMIAAKAVPNFSVGLLAKVISTCENRTTAVRHVLEGTPQALVKYINDCNVQINKDDKPGEVAKQARAKQATKEHREVHLRWVQSCSLLNC